MLRFTIKTESIEIVRDTAIERRNLSKAQRVDIVLRSDDLIGKIRNQAKENQGTRNDLTSRSLDPKVKQYSTRKKLADIAGISESTMKRVMRAKKEDEELYKKVVSGEVSPKKSQKICGQHPQVRTIKVACKQKFRRHCFLRRDLLSPSEKAIEIRPVSCL